MISNNPRSGFIRQNLGGAQAYGSFVPASLPPNPSIQLDEEMNALLLAAKTKLAYLKGAARHIPNMEMFLAMYVRKEALFSSQIEGTQATLDDILDPTLDHACNRDILDAVDNVKAVLFAVKQLQDVPGLPLSLRLLRETHKVLLKHSRGQDKSPGDFRHSQNWIGPTGCSLREASYVPPKPDDMTQALNALELYLHAPDALDPLIRAALIHYQFETIHPFLDGNGRIGRLLILLFLIDQKVIDAPYVYVSYFLKIHRTQYYEHLTSVRENGTYEEWVKFFLRAAGEAAQNAIESIEKLSTLAAACRERILSGVRGTAARAKLERFLSYLEGAPIIEIKRTADDLDWSFPTTSKYVRIFCEAGILKEISGRSRGRVFAFEDYLAVLRKDMQPL